MTQTRTVKMVQLFKYIRRPKMEAPGLDRDPTCTSSLLSTTFINTTTSLRRSTTRPTRLSLLGTKSAQRYKYSKLSGIDRNTAKLSLSVEALVDRPVTHRAISLK